MNQVTELPTPAVPYPDTYWSLEEALALCAMLEMIAPRYGAHIGLTGGCLYKRGLRKDVDILVYRIRQESHINIDGFFAALSGAGIEKLRGFGWCYKAQTAEGKGIDFFFPEEQGGEYESGSVPLDLPRP